MPVPIFVPISPQGIISTTSFTFAPMIVPTSLHAPRSNASLMRSAKSEMEDSMGTCSNILPTSAPPLPLPDPEPPLSSLGPFSTFSSSKPKIVRLILSTASFTFPAELSASSPHELKVFFAMVAVSAPVSLAMNILTTLKRSTNFCVTKSTAGAIALISGATIAPREFFTYRALVAIRSILLWKEVPTSSE